MQREVRVLVVDDSSLVREMLRKGLSDMPGIQVVATAGDAYDARDKIVELAPDVMTLDIEMPRMCGLDFLKRLIPQYPMPVVMVSALTAPGAQSTLEALDYGAVDFALKPSTLGSDLTEMIRSLAEKIRTAAGVRVSVPAGSDPVSRAPATASRRVGSTGMNGAPTAVPRPIDMIAIGASTGGTVALSRVVARIPPTTPGMVIVQHMPPVFTRMFAERLDSICDLEVKEAADGDVIATGRILVAPGDKHLEVIEAPSGYRVRCRDGEKVNGHRPSVEVLFDSVARVVGSNAIGVMLTGMGRDGASAMLDMRRAGARTVAQDEESSTVFGMPREAWTCGAAERLVHIDDMAEELAGILEGRR